MLGNVWNGLITEELRQLGQAYADKFNGVWPDWYDELNYDVMTYERFVGYMKECLEKGLEMPDVVP